MMVGPIDYIIVGFKGSNFDGSVLQALSKASQQGLIRVLDLLFIMKDADGTVLEAEFEDQSDDLKATFGDLVHESDLPLLTTHDVEALGEHLENDTAAGILVIEHLWSRDLKQALVAAGGFLVDDGRIHPEKVAAAMQALDKASTGKERHHARQTTHTRVPSGR